MQKIISERRQCPICLSSSRTLADGKSICSYCIRIHRPSRQLGLEVNKENQLRKKREREEQNQVDIEIRSSRSMFSWVGLGWVGN